MDKTARIRDLNDAFRRTFVGGRVFVTAGVNALPVDEQTEILTKVRTFDAFNGGNDPYAEHDFVAIEHAGAKYFAKIDYYAQDLRSGCEDPADPLKTVRVLTVMRADEY